jgi:hypothetical protein
MAINYNNYSILYQYDLYNESTITGPLTINGSGNYYCSSGPLQNINGTYLDDPYPHPALAQLGLLKNDINNISPVTTITGSGTITFSPGAYNITSYHFTNGTIINLDGNSTDQFIFISTSELNFRNNITITCPNVQPKNIFWLANSIHFQGTSPPYIPGTFISDTTIVFNNACTVTGNLYSSGELSFGGLSNIIGLACYCKGTMILTQHGFMPIEKIKAGHQVVTKGKIKNNTMEETDPDLKPVLWISSFKVTNPNRQSKPICIEKNALGNVPFKDLYVSPEHSLLIDNQMITAKRLVNGDTIYQADCEDVVYYHIELEEHCAIFANGVLAESYLDARNRYVFKPSLKLTKEEIERVNIKDVKVKHLRKCLNVLKNKSTIMKL